MHVSETSECLGKVKSVFLEDNTNQVVKKKEKKEKSGMWLHSAHAKQISELLTLNS